MLIYMAAVKLAVLTLALVLNYLSAQNTNDCYDYNESGTWGCFLLPTGCENSDCKFIVKWQDQATSVQFQLATYINTNTGSAFKAYTALGFSNDRFMGNDSVAMCRTSVYAPSMVVESYYNDNNRNSDVVSPLIRTVGILTYSVSISDKYLLCNFTRLKSIVGVDKFFDISKPYYILVAYGITNSLASPVWHHENAFSSARPQSFQVLKSSTDPSMVNEYDVSVPLEKAHSCLMVLAWILFGSTGILIARYYKFMFYSKIICFNRCWLAIHRSLMIFVLALIIISFLLILYRVDWRWVSTDKPVVFVHSIFGIVAISLTVIQGIIGFLHTLVRMDLSNRKILHFTHRTVGVTAYILAMVAIFLGVNISQMNLGRVGWGIMIGWAIWSVLLPTIIEIITVDIENLNESKAQRIADNDPNREEIIATNLKTFRGKFNRIKSILMILHLIIASGMSVALVVCISLADGEKFN